jgi:predicted dienelactone hydrolase
LAFRSTSAALAALLAFSALGGAARAAYPVGKVRISVPAPTASRGDRSGSLRVVVWYPAADGARPLPDLIGAPGKPLFVGGEVAARAALRASPTAFPFVVLSHGTGGSAMQMAWLGTRLAVAGYIAAAVDHPGNNFVGGYTAQGFSLWWLRASDLSHVIDAVLADARFGAHVDRARIFAAGFSLGGATMIEIAGGREDPARLEGLCGKRTDHLCGGPREFPDLTRQTQQLARTDPSYRAALASSARSYRDPRVRAVFAIAPALGPAFVPATLKAITIPAMIVAGFADDQVPVEENAFALADRIPNAALYVFPRPVTHYTFLDEFAPQARTALAKQFGDVGDQRAVHDATAHMALTFFARAAAGR